LTQEQGMSLGSYLRQERERRNTSLESIAQVTRITLSNLEAMERDEFHLLPAPVFIRGFLRTYATHLGIDPKEVLALYEVQTNFSRASPPKKIALSPKKIRPLVKITLFALALGILFYFFYPKTPPPPPSPPASAPEAPRLPTPPDKPFTAEESSSPRKDLSETPTVSTPPPTPSPGLGEDPKKQERRHVLKIKAKEMTWLRIQTDDQQEVDALLQPQETATWTARRQFKLTVGNAGGVDISFNGVPQGRMGDSGEVVRLLLPKEIKRKVTPEEVKEP
jgi:cytoskeleton protein RodZ